MDILNISKNPLNDEQRFVELIPFSLEETQKTLTVMKHKQKAVNLLARE